MVTAAGSEELQVTDTSCSVLPPVNVPVAVKDCAVSRGMVRLPGVTAMETRLGGVRVVGVYSSALVKSVPVEGLYHPATSTVPFVSRVAVAA